VDETDLLICGMLMADSRTPYRDLADKLGISLQAVHRRVQELREKGVLGEFSTHISMEQAGAVVLYVFATSSMPPEEAVKRLSEDDRTYVVVASDRGFLSIGALLRGPGEMEDYVAKATASASLSQLRVGIMSRTELRSELSGQGKKEELSDLDLRIIDALAFDSRQPIEEVALKVGAAASTVRRRLQAMVEHGAVQFTVDFHPHMGEVIVSQVFVELDEGKDKNTILGDIMQAHPRALLFGITFGNLPSFLLIGLWAKSMREINESVKGIADTKGVRQATSNIVVEEWRFPTWRDRIPSSAVRRRRDGPGSTA
jgi:DNA-binding Lrp family transcriptional regulator